MFTPQRIYSLVKAKPFKPLMLMTSDGQSHIIRHPDFVRWFADHLDIGFPIEENNYLLDRSERLAYEHITSITEVTPQPS